MLKASALYLVIIVSLVLAVLSMALISTAYFYKLEYQKNLRSDRLSANLNSGLAIVMSIDYKGYDQDLILDLFKEEKDSVLLRKERWGLFDLALVKSFALKDTTKRSFFIGEESKDQTAIYLSDEDRPVSVSGNTQITGDGFLPKAGIKSAYVDGKAYAGKQLIKGKIRDSNRLLPSLNADVITYLEEQFRNSDPVKSVDQLPDSLINSFFNPCITIQLEKNLADLDNKIFRGKIILFADTIVHIRASSILQDIQVYAPAIVVENGFKGNCQLFARDSIIIGRNTTFTHPSCLGVLKPEKSKLQAKIQIGSGSEFSGILFTYEKSRSDLQTLIAIGKEVHVQGEVFSSGLIKLEKPLSIDGSLTCNRFIMQTPLTLYENYLIDVSINRLKLSPYYLSSALFKQEKSRKNKILKWLN
jgi:hypothetical protein